MDRKEFLTTCGALCLAGVGSAVLFTSCGTTSMFKAVIDGPDLKVPLTVFAEEKEGVTSYKKFVLVHNDQLQYPICVYRFSSAEYTAIWMSCTHRGTELKASEHTLSCPAHGSEFSNLGIVMQGPADKPLRTFPTRIVAEQLLIALV
jgi:Rieske Fe-S protein